jgi:molybdate transport system substrate-binding protein
MNTRLRRLVPLMVAALIVSTMGSASAADARESVVVYAAASLTNAVNDVLDLCAGGEPGTIPESIKVSFASSSVLAKQIEHGAEAAIFLSANAAWMDYLDERGLLAEGSRHPLMSNRLAVIAPKSSPAGDTPLRELFAGLPSDGRIAMGDPDHVPAGMYAKAALAHIGAWEAVRTRVARTANVRAALALVETGAAPIGIVYATDALVSRGVRTIALFPLESHPPIVYETALVHGHRTPAVDRLQTCIRGASAANTFERHGFLILGTSRYADTR